MRDGSPCFSALTTASWTIGGTARSIASGMALTVGPVRMVSGTFHSDLATFDTEQLPGDAGWVGLLRGPLAGKKPEPAPVDLEPALPGAVGEGVRHGRNGEYRVDAVKRRGTRDLSTAA